MKSSNVDSSVKRDLNYYLEIKNELEKCIDNNIKMMDEFKIINIEVNKMKYFLIINM